MSATNTSCHFSTELKTSFLFSFGRVALALGSQIPERYLYLPIIPRHLHRSALLRSNRMDHILIEPPSRSDKPLLAASHSPLCDFGSVHSCI
jgi:hypothetical protein